MISEAMTRLLTWRPWKQAEPEPPWFLFKEEDVPLECGTIFSWTENTLDQPPRDWPVLPPELIPPLTMEACEHGVICLSDPVTAEIFLWNPVLGHVKKLPYLPVAPDPGAFRVGIGHVASTGDLKVKSLLSL